MSANISWGTANHFGGSGVQGFEPWWGDGGPLVRATATNGDADGWHGPTGGHDHTDGNHFWDILDVTEFVQGILLEFLWQWKESIGETLRGAGITVLAIQGAALLCLQTLKCGARKYQAGRRTTARLCLVLGILGQVYGAGAMQTPQPTRRAAQLAPRGDLEIWAQGQLTRREQMAANVARWVYERPLEHSSGVARDPAFTIAAETPQDIVPEAGIDRVHATAWVAVPYYEAEVLDFELRIPATVNQLTAAVQGTSTRDNDYEMTFVPSNPQLGQNYVSYVAFPAWIQETDRVVLLIDATAIGGGTFAAYLRNPITRENVLMNLVEGWPAGLQAFLGGGEQPMRSGRTYQAAQGGLVKILGPNSAPRWQEDVNVRLQDPARWNQHAALPHPLDGLHMVYQAADDQVLEEIYSEDERTLEVSAEEALRYEHGDVWVAVPSDRLQNLAHLGRRVWGQVAVLDGWEQHGPTTPVIFLDIRGLGLFPQWTQIEGNVFRPVEFYDTLGMPPLPGWTLLVQGGSPRDDGENIDVQNEDVLHLFLARDGSEAAESADDGSSDGGGMHEEDSCSGSQPSSGDESTASQHDGQPRGPPPPRPVNEPEARSRSPRRNGALHALGRMGQAGTRELRLKDYIVEQTFDLTQVRLPLPHSVDDIWPIFRPWSGVWMCWDLSGTDLNEAAREVLKQAVSWQEVIGRADPSGPRIHIYTDGSANEVDKQSGYSVVILMKIDATVALFGVMGGQILGNPDSPWPCVGPAALTAEQVAVAAALLWVVQAKSMLPCIDCSIHFDCLAAGRAATGQWAPVDRLSVQIHNLELAIREIPGVRLEIAHVKGHAGNGWNELADGVAKSAAKGGSPFAEPPRDACRALLDTNLDWVGFEMAAGRTGAIDVANRALQWSEEPCPHYPVSAEQLIPTECRLNKDDTGEPVRFRTRVCTFNVQGLRGNYRYMEEQFDAAGFQIVMLQETKTPGGQCHSGRYYRLASEAERHWGTAIWVSKTHGMVDLDGSPIRPNEADFTTLCSEPRLLVVVVKIGSAKVGLIAGHCPHAARTEERDAFLRTLGERLAQLKPAQILLCGVDLNGRLPAGCMHVSGSLEFHDPDTTGEMAAQIMQDNGLWAPSTYEDIHVGESATYCHPNGSESRIDYVFVGGRATVAGARSWVAREIDNGSPNDDHRAVSVELQGELQCGRPRPHLLRRRYDLDKLNTEEGRAIIVNACRTFQQPGWLMHPDEHCWRVELHLEAALLEHFPRVDQRSRASYIPDIVWELRQKKCQLRWRTRRRRGLWKEAIRVAFSQWKHSGAEPWREWLRKQGLLYDLCAAAVKLTTQRIRRIIAEAKDRFLRSLTTGGPQDVASILQRAKKAGVGAKGRQFVQRELPKLIDPATGLCTASAQDRDHVWLEYFGEQEAGNILSTQQFIQETGASRDEVRDDWDWKFLPSVVEIESVLRTTAKGKSAGLDGIPSDVLRASPSDFANMIQPLYIKALVRGRQPIQWRGGVLFEAYKGAGPQCDTASHRSLYISSFVGKTLHRVMRTKVREHIDNFLHPLHCGSRPGMPVLFPSLFIIEHLRRCAQRGLSTAVIYVDTKAAYYRLVRQLATGDLRVDRCVEELFHRFGLDGEDVAELRDLILEGGMLQLAEIADPIRAAVRDFHRDSWFTSRFTDGTAVCRSTAGSRPGASWADTIFAVIYARILYRVHEAMEGEDLNFSLPWDPESGVFASDPADQPQAAFDTTWADDSAYALQAEHPEQLMTRVSRVGSLIISAFRSHGLDPNLKRHKTSAMIGVRGKGATAARRKYFASGKPELELRDLRENIQIVPHYKHLGCYVDIGARLHNEVRHRTALATAAYEKAKDLLLQNRDLTLETRSSLFQCVVVSTYHNLAIWVATGRQWEAMSEAFSRLVRRLLCRHVSGDELLRVPLPMAHWATGCWPLELYARRSRISTLISLAKKGPPILWAMLQNEDTWCAQIQNDLRWLVDGEQDKWPEIHATAWPLWWQLLREQAARIKRCAHRVNAKEFRNYKRLAAVDICKWYLYRQLPQPAETKEVEQPWTCLICDKSFRKKSALGVHFFSTHGRCAEYRFFLQGTRCQSCQTEFHTRGRLEDHLRATPKCVRVLRRTCTPGDVAPPGYGSKGRRKNEAEHYTPAVPAGGQPTLEHDSGAMWSEWQTKLHADICAVLLEDPGPHEVEDQLGRKMRLFPLYLHEIQEVVEHLLAEIECVHDDKELEQWTEEQYHAIRDSLVSWQRGCVHGTSRTQREPQRHLTMAMFRQVVKLFDWQSACQRQGADNGTQKAPLYRMPERWETAWRRDCDGAVSAVVVRDPLLLLHKELRELWQTFLKGGWPRLRAPQSFWEHSLADPFRPFREDVA